MAPLQDRRIKQPDPNGGDDLNARQWVAGKKTAHNTQRVKREAPPQQSGDGCIKVCQRWQMIKNRMQLMRLKLAFLDQIHDAGDASESERAIGHDRNRSVKFQPRIGWHFHRMTTVDWRNEREAL